MFHNFINKKYVIYIYKINFYFFNCIEGFIIYIQLNHLNNIFAQKSLINNNTKNI